MKKLLIASCLILMASSAHAQRMRDWSMPVDESLSQPMSPSKKIPSNYDNFNDTYRPQDRNDRGSYQMQEYGQGSSHFMDNYCDPNAKIGVAVRSDISECIQQKRSEVCQSYASLPNDARQVLNLTIDCAYARTEGQAQYDEDGNETTPIPMPRGCETSDANRLALLKKYYEDTYTSHALLFLPDLALAGGGECVTGGR